MIQEILLKAAGILLLVLAAAHITFPRILHWKEDAGRMSLLNGQIFLVHTFFIVIVLVQFGVLSLFFARHLLDPSPLSQAILAGMAIFWFLRLLVQLFVYKPVLWKGDSLRTAVHVGFTLFWSFLTVVYGSALLGNAGHHTCFPRPILFHCGMLL